MESKLRCCIIYKEDYPWDVRVQKIADTLVTHGHEVVILCRNLDQLPRHAQMDGYEIQRLPAAKRWPRFIRAAINVPLWLNPFWIFAGYRTTSTMHADVIIVRDLPLTFTAILIGRLRKARVIFDMAECYPEMYASAQRLSRRRGLSRWLTRTAKNPTLATLYENQAIRLVDKILVMIEESHDRLLTKGISPDKIHIVRNTPVLPGISASKVSHDSHQLRLVYVGFLGPTRGLDYLLRGVYEYLKLYPDIGSIKVDIVGTGAIHSELMQLKDELQLGHAVELHGWLSHKAVADLREKGNVGVLTYPNTTHWNNTIPNKLFDYMLSGMPVLATDVAPIARIVRGAGAGLICEHNSPRDIGKKLGELRDPALRAELGTRGRSAVLERYNWGVDSQNIQRALEDSG